MRRKKRLKKNKKTDHRIAQMAHTMRRSRQRYGISLGSKDYKAMLDMIKTNQFIDNKKLTNTRSLFVINYKGKDLYAIYNKGTNRICTVLTPEIAKQDFYLFD